MAIYYVYSGAGGSNNGSSWANAFTTLTAAFAVEVAGDTLYVAHDHAESTAAAITLTSSGTSANITKIVCVNRAGSVPPVSADRRATAQVSTTGASAINLAGFAHYDGIIFSAGSAASNANINVPSASGQSIRLDNCSLRLGNTGTGSRIQAGGASVNAAWIELNNTTMSFGAVNQAVILNGVLKWRNTPSALLGTIPSNLLTPQGSSGGEVECIGVDLSAAGSGKIIAGVTPTCTGQKFRFIDCKLDAAVTKATVPGARGAQETDFVRSGSAGVNYTVYSHRMEGLLIEETTIVRTGGASDGTTAIAWKIVTTANCVFSLPFECPVIAIWNDVIGSAVTATVEGIWGGGATPLDTECWLECEFLSDASSPMGGFAADCAADLLTAGVNQTSSTATWGGSTTKFKLAVSFTPQQKGWVFARVKCAKASSTFYIDPLVTLT